MCDKEELFVVGQQVTWRDPSSAITQHAITRYGMGPFVVIGEERVPNNKCACGSKLNDEYHRYGGCPYADRAEARKQTLREIVGHPQWIKVTGAGGKRVGNRFSGYYFTAREATASAIEGVEANPGKGM